MPSASATATTEAVAAPSDVQATVNSDTDATLTWTDNSSDENGFEIDWSADSGNTFEELDTVAADVTTYDASTLVPGTSYIFSVTALADAGDSKSAESDAVGMIPPPPAAPSANATSDSGE